MPVHVSCEEAGEKNKGKWREEACGRGVEGSSSTDSGVRKRRSADNCARYHGTLHNISLHAASK